MIDLARAGVERHGDLVLLEKLRQMCRLRGVDLEDVEAALLRACLEGVRERGVNVRQDNSLEAIVAVQLHPDDGPHATHSDDHCVCHSSDCEFVIANHSRVLQAVASLYGTARIPAKRCRRLSHKAPEAKPFSCDEHYSGAPSTTGAPNSARV